MDAELVRCLEEATHGESRLEALRAAQHRLEVLEDEYREWSRMLQEDLVEPEPCSGAAVIQEAEDLIAALERGDPLRPLLDRYLVVRELLTVSEHSLSESSGTLLPITLESLLDSQSTL